MKAKCSPMFCAYRLWAGNEVSRATSAVFIFIVPLQTIFLKWWRPDVWWRNVKFSLMLSKYDMIREGYFKSYYSCCDIGLLFLRRSTPPSRHIKKTRGTKKLILTWILTVFNEININFKQQCGFFYSEFLHNNYDSELYIHWVWLIFSYTTKLYWNE